MTDIFEECQAKAESAPFGRVSITRSDRLMLIEVARAIKAAGFLYLKDEGSVWGHAKAKEATAALLALASRDVEPGTGGNDDAARAQGR